MQPKVSKGRIVFYVFCPGVYRPAMVVETFVPVGMSEDAPAIVNLQVFTNGSVDDAHRRAHERSDLMLFRTSVNHDPEKRPGTWHWPPRE